MRTGLRVLVWTGLTLTLLLLSSAASSPASASTREQPLRSGQVLAVLDFAYDDALNVAPEATGARSRIPGQLGAATPGPRGSWHPYDLSADLVAPNGAARFVVAADGTTVDLVAAATRSSGKGDLTAAGHALSKHGTGQRAASSAFPSLSGNQHNWNLIAQGQIDDILSTGQMVQRTHPNHGPIIEVFAPDGRGARWYADGRFFGFLEP